MVALIDNLKNHGSDLMYTDIKQPLFRSVSYDRYSKVYGKNLELLKNYGVYYWPRFSKTSKEKACVEEDDNKRVNFEIYVSEQ